ncbi:hypothetical protein [Hyphomonas sp.]|jgi:PBP1b-binding outer membrane lipoprotein LpoB|uniref:hypothetical protein n=1 Tax=Hyphomonas sp. TaxID=87 RepID=UPI003002FCBF|tara:strand:+ start:287 stop:556 length:270 start_codon:yes stop_codon:yes gene_type:complete
MTRKHFVPGVLMASLLLVGCASYDNQDKYLLGQATADNIRQQSVRDVNLSNSKAVESTSGLRAANAVKALNEGKTKELRDSSVSASGGS